MESLVNKPDCEACKKLKELYSKEPDCAECMPELLPENTDAIRIWGLVKDQVITAGMDGTVIALNQLALWEAIDRFRIEAPLECFQKVLEVFNHTLMLKDTHSGGDSWG